MSSESSHPRINQFFASRKRKHLPSPAQGQKDAKHEKCRRSTGEDSPGAKGTLDNYLEKSPGAAPRPTASGVAPLRSDSAAKGKLILEDVSTFDVSREPLLVSNSGEGISRKVENMLRIGEQGEVKSSTAQELSSPVNDAIGNSELKRFATDFLSLYCSDLQSAVNHPVEEELKGQKRSSSPSTLVACAKKQCVSHHIDHPGEAGECHGDPKLETSNHDERDFSLRRCGFTPIKGMTKISPCMPGLLLTTENTKTPKSVSRNSIFSPGDDFWIEAIQVADGLHPELEKIPENTVFAKGTRSGDKLLKDELSCAAPQHAKTFNKPSNYDLTRDMPLKSSLQPLRKAEQESNLILSVTEHDGMSPLPVKYLDFSHDDNIHLGVMVKDNVGSTPLDGCGGVSSVEHKYSQCKISQMCSEGIACDASSVKKESPSKPTTNISCAEASISSSSMPSKSHGQINSWLPSQVCSVYMKKGVTKLYPWQVECLLVDGVLDKRNLVYSASTSAGKSFVAEILMLRRVLLTGKMAVLVLPYVSICAEKAEHLERLLEPLGKHVRSFYGSQGGGSLPKDTSVAVCTIEKANSLLNRLLEEGRLSELGIIVIDELHMVADRHRGYLLELMLTKLRYASGDGNPDSSSEGSPGTSSGKSDPAHGLQIVGMSATMPNVAAVADWLQAALYQTDFRPVPLEEYIKVGNTIFDKKMDIVRVLPKAADLGGKDPDHVVELCNEIVQEGHSVLIFCSSRKGCESTARHVSRFLKSFSVGTCDKDYEYNDASSAIEALKRCPAGLDPILEETIPAGVAYHHAGLTVEEREIIETCYRKGLIRVLTATSTLAAGVNLPARRVIFRQPRIGRDFIDGTRYRQMAGRAGRTGIDTKGDSILLCRPDEIKRITALLNDSCPPLQSCLSEDKNGMTHAIMEVVAGGIVQTANDINRYVRCTLLNSTKPFEEVVRSAQDSLRWLCKKKFLEWNDDTKLYSTTPLGRAAFGSSLTPEESLVVLDDLTRAREGFVLASDLHLVFLVTPINVEVEPDWELYYERFMELSSIEQSVGNRVGVVEPFLMRMAHGAPMPVHDRLRGKKNRMPDKQTGSLAIDNTVLFNEQIIRVSRRFYVALMLSRLVQEVPVADVCNAFKVARGMIQALQENAGRFALMVSVFCERLGWHDLGGLISKFQNRVSFGVRAEIAELTTIPYVKGSRARALYKAGLRTPLSIAEASTTDIAKALFENSSWVDQSETAQRRMQLGLSKKIKNAARKIVLDQAEEARMVAFSTFKSLGLNIPQFSRPLLANMAVETPIGVVSACPEVTRGGINNSETGNIYMAARQGESSGFKYASPITKEGSSTVRKASSLDISGEVDTKGDVHDHSDFNNSGIVAKTSMVCSSTKLDLGVIEFSRPSFSEPKAGCLLDREVKTYNKVGNNNGERKCNSNDSYISDKGPINASKFPGGIDCFLNELDATSEFCFDLHFVTRSSHQSSGIHEVFGLAVCWESSPVYYCNFPKDLLGYVNLSACDTWEVAKGRWIRLSNIMGKRGVKKVTWNLKIQIQAFKFPYTSVQRFGDANIGNKMLNNFEIVDSSFVLLPSISVHDGIDVSLVTWILWPDEESKSTPNLEKTVKKRLSSEAAAAASRDGRWKSQMRRAAHNGCCRRVAQVRALSSALWKLLLSEELSEALIKIENPLVEVLAEMEFWGIGVDMEACLNARHILIRKVKELEKEAYKLAGMPFSLYTSADIANVLYTHLKLPVPQGCEKGKLHPSTNKQSLDILRDQHPIISVIKEHRTLAKLLNSTLGSICSRARMCVNSQKYIIQGHWLQTSTATGRLSMEEPNLQCVEHTLAFTTSKTNESNSSSELDNHQINARDFFIPTQENWILLTADYSQIELRLMAHFSKDHALIELLSKPNGDVFVMISSRWKSKPESAISSEERDYTKRLIYGILYGMGANSLAEQLGCSPTEAAEKIQSFKSSFPGVASWLHEAVAFCRDKGYVKTLMGRKRFLPKIKFGNSKEKSKAQRQAVNSICQGSAADIIKMAMLTIHSVITEGNEVFMRKIELADKFSNLRGRCHIILQVHDELVLEVDPDYASEAANLLQMSMETAASLLVPLHIKLKIGRTWGSLKPFQSKS